MDLLFFEGVLVEVIVWYATFEKLIERLEIWHKYFSTKVVGEQFKLRYKHDQKYNQSGANMSGGKYLSLA